MLHRCLCNPYVLVEHIGHFGRSSLVADTGTPQSYGQLSALSILSTALPCFVLAIARGYCYGDLERPFCVPHLADVVTVGRYV